jgi:signal transduction histidine kinase
VLASLRFRLFLVVLLAIIPTLAVIAYTGSVQRQEAILDVQQAALRIARLVSSDHGRLISGARDLLVTIAHLPGVRSGNAATCQQTLARLKSFYGMYLNLGVIRPDGTLVCSAVAAAQDVNLSDRSYFKRAIASREFAIGEYQVGRVTGKPSVNVGYPVLENGRLRSVVFAALDLAVLNELVARAGLPPGSTFTVVDDDGVILVRFPDSAQWIGRKHPGAEEMTALRTLHAGIGEAHGADGTLRLLGFTALRDADGAGNVYASIGIPRTAAVAAANRMLVQNVVIIVIVAFIALGTARLVCGRLVLRHVDTLLRAVRRVAAGDLEARAGGPYRGELGEVSRAIDEMAATLKRDADERARVEVELTQHREMTARNEKLAALGRLAAGVGHELKNPLTVIDMRLQMLARNTEPEHLPRHLSSLTEASQRMKRIMAGLSNYARPVKAEPIIVDVGDLIRGSAELVAYAARHASVTVEVDVPAGTPAIRVERSQLTQVLVNLAMNAIEAMTETGGGTLTLRARRDDAQVMIEVADTGAGIAADRLETIWQPFYSTKRDGTGLGLSIVRGLVEEQEGGTITVASVSGGGTVFTIRLPAR